MSLLQNANHKICIWFGNVDRINAVMIIKSKVIILRSCLYFLADRTEKCRENLTVFLTFFADNFLYNQRWGHCHYCNRKKKRYMKEKQIPIFRITRWPVSNAIFMIQHVHVLHMKHIRGLNEHRETSDKSYCCYVICLWKFLLENMYYRPIITIVYIDAAIQLDENAIVLHPKLPNTHLCWLNLRWIGKNWNVE